MLCAGGKILNNTGLVLVLLDNTFQGIETVRNRQVWKLQHSVTSRECCGGAMQGHITTFMGMAGH